MIWGILHYGGTFFDITSLAALIGACWLNLWLVSCREETDTIPANLIRRLRGLQFLCLAALIVSSVNGLFQRSMEMSGSGLATVLPLLPTVILKTHYGTMWLIRIAGIIAALTVMLIAGNRTGSRFFGSLLLCAGVVIAFTRSASGHPADSGDFSSPQLADYIHLLAISLLGGGLLATGAVFRRSSGTGDDLQSRLVSCVSDRFYHLSGPALAVLVLTGTYNAWLQVGSFSALASTPYGRLLLVKLIFFLVFALLFIAPPEHRRDGNAFEMRFLRRTRIAAAIVLGILVCVGVMVHKIPAKHQVHLDSLRRAAELKAQSEVESHAAEPKVTFDTKPANITAGTPVEMTVRIQDRAGGPLAGLTIIHERILHAVIIGQDLEVFAHIHPEDLGPITAEMVKKAVFPLRFTFPRPGKYLIGLDFAADDESYSKSLVVDVAAPGEMGRPRFDDVTKKNFDGYDVTLKLFPGKARAGGETTLRYHVEKNGVPVTDLQPYLGAAMHLAVVSEDMKTFIHAHGTVPGESHSHDHLHAPPPPLRFGPDIDAGIDFPAKGNYKIFSQVSHNGTVLLFEFTVDVE